MKRFERQHPDPRVELLSRFRPEDNPWVAVGKEFGPDVLERVMELLDKPRAYVPDPHAFWQMLERDLRDARICAEHNGRNTKELGDRYGLDPRHVRRIVTRKK